MKIYCITSQPSLLEDHKQRLEKIGELTIIDASQLSDDEVIDRAADANILIVGSSGVKRLSDRIFSSLKNLKFVSLLTVGTAWVDLESAKKNGILVSNIKGANTESVAEHVWGMILNLSKRISEFDRDIRKKGAYEFNHYKGVEVYGKTIGLIGTGNIGSKVARIAAGFDMKILGFNKSKKSVKGIEIVSINRLLCESDVVVVSLPLTDETKDMIGADEIGKMKDGVILVNCAIEGLVNKDAVVKAIKDKKLFGFGIETDIMKPLLKDDPYLQSPNILVTVHNGFNTTDADKKSYDMMVKNIEDFLNGSPNNIVN